MTSCVRVTGTYAHDTAVLSTADVVAGSTQGVPEPAAFPLEMETVESAVQVGDIAHQSTHPDVLERKLLGAMIPF